MAIDVMMLLQAELDMHNPPPARVFQLEQLQKIAASRIQKRGITLDLEDAGDAGLLVSYTAYLFRRRRQEAGPQMPEWLRLDLNDRLMSEKGRVNDG